MNKYADHVLQKMIKTIQPAMWCEFQLPNPFQYKCRFLGLESFH